jgi:ribosomal-protein-alanine N-acetyltransferase
VQEIHIRQARKEDLKLIHAIETTIYPSPWTFNFFRIVLHMNKNMFFVASLDEKIIGYVIGKIENTREKHELKKKGHIMNIAVSKEFQGKGIGTILLDEIESRFIEQDVFISYLEVRESNKRAQKIYEKRGYDYIKLLEKYYGDENGFIMSKKLTR